MYERLIYIHLFSCSLGIVLQLPKKPFLASHGDSSVKHRVSLSEMRFSHDLLYDSLITMCTQEKQRSSDPLEARTW